MKKTEGVLMGLYI